MLVAILFTALLIIRVAPESLVGACLKRVLVDWPAAFLSRLHPVEAIFGMGMIGLGILCFCVLQGDAAILYALMSPGIVIWFASFEMGLYVEAMVALGLISVRARLRLALHGIRSGLALARRSLGRRIAARPEAAPRQRRTRPAIGRKPANDDADGEGWAPPAWGSVRAA